MDLTSSCQISTYMPRFYNSASSKQSRLMAPTFGTIDDCFTWTSTALQASSTRTHFYRSDRTTLQEHGLPMAYIFLCVRFTCFVHLSVPVALDKGSQYLLKFRHRRNTRYGWLARPYPTGTFTLQDSTSFLVALTPN